MTMLNLLEIKAMARVLCERPHMFCNSVEFFRTSDTTICINCGGDIEPGNWIATAYLTSQGYGATYTIHAPGDELVCNNYQLAQQFKKAIYT